MRHVASKNLHIHSVFHCGTNWRPVLKILQKQRSRYPFDSLISHRMGLDELVAKMEVVTNPNECVKVEVVPHARLSRQLPSDSQTRAQSMKRTRLLNSELSYEISRIGHTASHHPV